tara:strand:+ start:2974 stop:3393 length:420 start_codon:yes stop_codon:yes gene_type:complete
MNTCTIKIPELKLFGYHGCYEKEKKLGQEFQISIEIVIESKKGASWINSIDADDLNLTLDYSDIVIRIKEKFTQKKYNTLERLAYSLSKVPIQLQKKENSDNRDDINLKSVMIRVRKFNPIGMNVPYVEVEYLNVFDYE